MYNRNLRKPSAVKNIYKFISVKNDAVIMCEGRLEFDTCFHLEYNSDVVSFVSQPTGFKYLLDGTSHCYTPDFQVSYRNKSSNFLEIKSYSRTLDPQFKHEFVAKKLAAQELGSSLYLVTDRQIRVNPTFNNLKLLHRYCGVRSLNQLQKRLLTLVQENRLVTIKFLSEQTESPMGETNANMLALISSGYAKANLDEEAFGPATLVWISEQMSKKEPFSDESENEHSPDIRKPNSYEVSLIKDRYRSLDDSTLVERDLDSFPQELKQEALQRFKLLSLISKDIQGGWTPKNIDPLLDKHISQVNISKPSARTVCRWMKAYTESRGDLKSLVKKHHNKGSREPKVIGDEEFYYRAVERFLVAEKPSFAKAYEFYEDSIITENDSIVSGKIPIVSYTTFRKRIKKIPPYTVAYERHGKYYADLLFHYYAKHKPPTRVLERVEIDHTPLDLILIDDELWVPLGRPYLTMLLDVFSGCIVGFHLGFRAPSYVSVSKAIIHAVKPKDYIKDLPIDIMSDWPCRGKMESLVVDNGAEFWSKSLDDACKEAKIGVQYNPIRKPWLKPFIERSFGVINECLLDVIPGKTFSNVLEKADYDPKKDAIMRFSTFVEEFHRWIVDVYHQKADTRSKRIPSDLWQKGCEVIPPLKISEEEQEHFNVVMGILEKRTLSKAGIKYKELIYDCEGLADYRKRYPQTKESRLKMLKIDPDDMSSIYVYLVELEGYLKVPCTDPVGYTKKLSLHQHLVILRSHRKYIEGKVDVVSLAKARMALHQRIEEEQDEMSGRLNKKRSIKGQKKQAEYAGVGSDGIGTASVSVPEQDASNLQEEINNTDLLAQWEAVIKGLK